MQTVPYTKALEVLLEGGTVRRVLPAGHSPILYIAPLRAEWQPAIPGLTERGRVWIGEVHTSHDAAKRDGSRSYTVSDEDRAGDGIERDLEQMPADFAALIATVERLTSELEAAKATAVRLKWETTLDTTHLVLIHGGMDLRIAYIRPSQDGQYFWGCCQGLFMYKVATRNDALTAIAHCFPLWKIPALVVGSTNG